MGFLFYCMLCSFSARGWKMTSFMHSCTTIPYTDRYISDNTISPDWPQQSKVNCVFVCSENTLSLACWHQSCIGFRERSAGASRTAENIQQCQTLTHILNWFPIKLTWPIPGAKIEPFRLCSCKYGHQTNISSEIFRYSLNNS